MYAAGTAALRGASPQNFANALPKNIEGYALYIFWLTRYGKILPLKISKQFSISFFLLPTR